MLHEDCEFFSLLIQILKKQILCQWSNWREKTCFIKVTLIKKKLNKEWNPNRVWAHLHICRSLHWIRSFALCLTEHTLEEFAFDDMCKVFEFRQSFQYLRRIRNRSLTNYIHLQDLRSDKKPVKSCNFSYLGLWSLFQRWTPIQLAENNPWNQICEVFLQTGSLSAFFSKSTIGPVNCFSPRIANWQLVAKSRTSVGFLSAFLQDEYSNYRRGESGTQNDWKSWHVTDICAVWPLQLMRGALQSRVWHCTDLLFSRQQERDAVHMYKTPSVGSLFSRACLQKRIPNAAEIICSGCLKGSCHQNNDLLFLYFRRRKWQPWMSCWV